MRNNRAPLFNAPWQAREAWRVPFGPMFLVLSFLFAGLVLGLAVILFPPSTVLKLSAVLLLGLVLVFAVVAGRVASVPADGRIARSALYAWVFLVGAFPGYVPFRYGALPGMNPLRLTLALALAAWLFALISAPALRARMWSRIKVIGGPVWLLLLYLFWQLVSALFGDEPGFSLYSIGKIYLTPMLIFLMALTIVRDRTDVVRVCVALAAGALVGVLFAALEWRLQTNLFLKYIPIGSEDQAGTEWILADKSRGGAYRVSGVFAHPLVLGEYACLALPVVWALALRQGWITRLMGAVLVPGLLFAVYVSHTRSSLVAVGVAVLAFAVMLGVRAARDRASLGRALGGWMALFVAAALFVALVGVAAYLVAGRTYEEAGSTGARVWMLNRGLHLLGDSPLTGFGAGLAAFKIGVMVPGQRNLTIDSYYLSAALESGYVGLSLFLAAVLVVLYRAFWGGLRHEGWYSVLMAALFAALTAILTIKIGLSLTHLFDLFYLLLALVCLLAMPAQAVASAAVQPRLPSRPAGVPAGERGAAW